MRFGKKAKRKVCLHTVDNKTPWEFLALITVIAGVFCILAAVVKLPEKRIVIEERWWTATTSVRYTTIDIDIDSDGNLTTGTSTHTRCSVSNEGFEMPVIFPTSEGCVMNDGDFLDYTWQFTIQYHLQEEKGWETAHFSPEMWDLLEPGREVIIKTNLFNTIMEVRDVTRH